MYKNKNDVNNSNNVKNINIYMEVFMRKDLNNRRIEEKNEYAWIWLACAICILAIAYVIIRIMGGKANEEQISEIAKYNTIANNVSTESSSAIGKTVNEVRNEITNNSLANEIKHDENTNSKSNTNTNTNRNEVSVKENNYVIEKNNKNENNNTTSTENEVVASENVEDLKFIMPVDGQIIKEFAKDNLIYSETLKEWVTHNGIDIKAEKTTVVKSAAKGKVESIKNDPRYGLTVIINHDNGFQTIYSNLLTAEFVVEGEEVEEGQTIGTVGNTATFEISDDFHLHFEILKNNEYVDPTLYIK